MKGLGVYEGRDAGLRPENLKVTEPIDFSVYKIGE